MLFISSGGVVLVGSCFQQFYFAFIFQIKSGC